MAVEIDEDGFEVEVGKEYEDNFDESAEYNVNIKVIGVGGGGCNALNHMAKLGIKDPNSDDDVSVEYIAVNTDVPSLKTLNKSLMRRVQIGRKCLKGRGAGGRPEVAAEAAREDKETIQQCLEGAALVFISAGMGGGTGTGAAPVIAEIAQEMGILTVGVVTKPFAFEREQKMNQAMKGIEEMRKHVDALLIIPNQRLLQLNEKQLTFPQAFAMVDDVLYRSVKIISDMVNKTAFMNTDFSDLCTIIQNAGDAHIAIGTGSGDKKVEDAVQQVVNSPLLETSIANAGRLLVNITISSDLLLSDVDEAMSKITEVACPGAQIISGANYNTGDVKDTIIISVIATCFSDLKTSSGAAKGDFGGDDQVIKTTTAGSPGDFITSTIGSDDGSDGFSDLEKIFRSKK